MTAESNKKISGFFIAAIGVLLAVIIYLHPEKLRVPAWVAYDACAAFVLAGAAIKAHATGYLRLHAWIVVLLLATMMLPGAWIALGKGKRACRGTFVMFRFLPNDLFCRIAFGFGASLVLIMLVWATRMALAKK